MRFHLDGSTFGNPEISEPLERDDPIVMTLLPGDLIFTGTPSGTALGQTSPAWLQPGALLRCGITGLGEQIQTVIAWEHQE